MKKVIITLLALLTVFTGYAQFKIGLKVSPGMILNRTFVSPDSIHVTNNGLKFTIPFGVFVDIPLTERYYFNTGVNLVGKVSDLNYQVGNGSISHERIKMQYIQVPVTVKLFTDEIAVDKKLYFQFGPAFEILINSKGDPKKYIDKIQFGDISFLFAGGIDLKIGPNTSMCVGLAYNRGLLNIIQSHSLPAEEFSLKNDMFLLEIGIKP
jgi:hypothetical protein